jgi:molecular chaperone GrpE
MTAKKTTDKSKSPEIKEIDNLKKEIQKLKNELKEKDEKLIRSYADFQNYQKRMEKELYLKEEEIKRKYLLELLDINELLKKAYEDKDPKDALKLMINNIEGFFEKENIKVIKCVGKKFDHNLHHAVTIIDKDDCEDNLIIEEVKKGYIIDDRLLRPSQVIVSKKKDVKKE